MCVSRCRRPQQRKMSMLLNYAAYHVLNHANDITTAPAVVAITTSTAAFGDDWGGGGKINDNNGNDHDDGTTPSRQVPPPVMHACLHAIATIFNHLKEFSVANFYL